MILFKFLLFYLALKIHFASLLSGTLVCVVVVSFLCFKMDNTTSDVFSLEDDEYNEMFITQTPRESLIDKLEYSQKERNYSVFSDEADFQSPVMSLVDKVRDQSSIYEDISDDDFDMNNDKSAKNFG